MNKSIHLNLLRDEERVSSSRVRLHVMAPILSALVAVGIVLWWAWLFTQTLVVQSQTRSAEAAITAAQTAFKQATDATNREQELRKQLAQIGVYRHGIARYGTFLRQLADHVPATIQLTSLELQEPPPQVLPVAKPRSKTPPKFGPEVPTESVLLRISGRTKNAASVDNLLEALRLPTFRDQIEDAAVPKDAFRQEQLSITRNGAATPGEDVFRFDVECTMKRRVFE